VRSIKTAVVRCEGVKVKGTSAGSAPYGKER